VREIAIPVSLGIISEIAFTFLRTLSVNVLVISALAIFPMKLTSASTDFLIDVRSFESWDTEMADAYIPKNTKYEDNPMNEADRSPNGGKGPVIIS
jgi:hypothetical protein